MPIPLGRKPNYCKACEGTGRSSSNTKCLPCNGTGFPPKPEVKK